MASVARVGLHVGCAALLLSGCGAQAPDHRAPDARGTHASTPSPARSGQSAASQRITFVPRRLTLPSGDVVTVQPAATRQGSLDVPEATATVGWWDGSAHIGDPFGSTVIAGHVDTAKEELAPFGQLLDARVGDLVVVAGTKQRATYRVTRVVKVGKDVLGTDSDALSQTGAHRLNLITCTGRWDPVTRHYDSNLVVTAELSGTPEDE